MFKMGCSMARRILTPGSAASGDQQQAGCFSTAPANSSSGNNNNITSSSSSNNNPSNKNSGRNANQANSPKASQPSSELDDFSKLKEDPRLPLNVRQIFKITKSWKAIARTTSKTGTAMFLALFEQNENLFHLFDRFQHLKGKELHDSMELREHAATVMATLDTSINSLSDYDNFVSYLHSIGQLHRKVPGFKREYFWEIEQPFMKAVKQTLDERCNETIEEIYKIAIKLIIETIAVGYGDDQDNGQGNAPEGPDRSRQSGGGGGGGGGSDGNNNKKTGAKEESSNNKSESKTAERIASGGGGQRARQCQQTPSERREAPKCPLVLAKRILWRLGKSANKPTLAGGGGGKQPESTGELVQATCKLMSATSETLAASCAGIRLDEHELSGAKLMNWHGLLVNLNRSLMKGDEMDERTRAAAVAAAEQQHGDKQNEAKQRRHKSATRQAGVGRASGRLSASELAAGLVAPPHDDCGRTALEANETAPDEGGGHRGLDGSVQLGQVRREELEEERASRAIDPIESQATNWAAADLRQTAAQDKPERSPKSRGDHDHEQTPSGGIPGDRRSFGSPAEAPIEPGSDETAAGGGGGGALDGAETSLRRLLLDIGRREHSSGMAEEAQLVEFIKVIILINKLELALATSKAAATARQRQATLTATTSSLLMKTTQVK